MIRYIYTVFIGVFLAIFVGMGIAVFYPAPVAPEPPMFYSKELTAPEQAQQAVFDAKQKIYEKNMRHYNRNASLAALIVAVVILTVSLIFENKLGVIADGLLLGGAFTLIYGIIRGMDTDSSKYRFLIAGLGLFISLTLGYIKFGNRQELSTK